MSVCVGTDDDGGESDGGDGLAQQGGDRHMRRKPISGKEVSVKRARNVLRGAGGFPEDVIEARCVRGRGGGRGRVAGRGGGKGVREGQGGRVGGRKAGRNRQTGSRQV